MTSQYFIGLLVWISQWKSNLILWRDSDISEHKGKQKVTAVFTFLWTTTKWTDAECSSMCDISDMHKHTQIGP